MSIEIRQAVTPQDVDAARALFRAYAESLDFNLCFQSFEQELATLPGAYAPPSGRLLLAWVEERPAGCIGVRKLEDGVCEMKRLYVDPGFRGHQLGRKLVERALDEARAAGYRAMRLDTIPATMGHAIALYRQFGFADIAAYRENPVPGAIYLERQL